MTLDLPLLAARGAAALGAILLGAGGMPPSALGQDQQIAPVVNIELNKMEDHNEGGCRLSLVFRNRTDDLFETLKLDLVMFGHDDVIARRLIVDASPLRPGKTTVKLFDVDGIPCAEVATVLLNDLPACVVADETRNDCIELVDVNSRAAATLTK